MKTNLNAGKTCEANSSGVASLVIHITGISTASNVSIHLISSCNTGHTCCHRSFCNFVNNSNHWPTTTVLQNNELHAAAKNKHVSENYRITELSQKYAYNQNKTSTVNIARVYFYMRF